MLAMSLETRKEKRDACIRILAMTVFGTKARSMLNLKLGLVEIDQILEGLSPGGATNGRNGEQRLGKTLADGHEMVNAREWSSGVAYVLGLGCSEGFLPLLFSILPESGELEIPQPEQEIRPFLLGRSVIVVLKALQLDEDSGVLVADDQLV